MNGCAPGLALIERLKATRKLAILMTFYNKKWGFVRSFVYIVRQSLVNLLLSTGYFGDRYRENKIRVHVWKWPL